MVKYFRTFFYPAVITYSYGQSKESVIAKIGEVLEKKVTFFSSNDMAGHFLNGDTFTINAVFPMYPKWVKYRTRLVGQVTGSQKGPTQIHTKATPGSVWYVLFFVTIIAGLIYAYKFMQTSTADYLFWSLAMLLIAPALAIGLSNVAIAVIRERYKMYIDKELNTGQGLTNNILA